MLMTCFKITDSNQGYYIITTNLEFMSKYRLFMTKGGSMVVMMSKLLGLDYPSYCRLMRDEYGAQLCNKTHRYISIHFPEKTKELIELVALLNKRINIYVNMRKA